jgi:hypothetical protein
VALVLRLGCSFLVIFGGCLHLDSLKQLWLLRGVLVIVLCLQPVICERFALAPCEVAKGHLEECLWLVGVHLVLDYCGTQVMD